ncbi:MAG: ribonuclease Z [Candidatus Asgardarchaeia archaeon]
MVEFEIIFLGTSGSVPTEDRNLPAIAIRRKREIFLFDAGEDVQRRFVKAKLGLNKPLKIFITHLHGDHINGIHGLLSRFALEDRSEKVELYGPLGIQRFISCLFEVEKLNGNPYYLEVHEFSNEGILVDADEYVIKAFKVNHRDALAFGYAFIEKPLPGRFHPEKARALGVPEGPLWKRLQRGEVIEINGRKVFPRDVMDPPRPGVKIVISGDTAYSENLIRHAKNADYLIHEAMYTSELEYEAEIRGHSTAKQAAMAAKKANVKFLFLTHISARYKDAMELENEAKAIFPNAKVAYDLMRIKIR